MRSLKLLPNRLCTHRSNARQCLLTRGLMPMLAAPSPSGDALLEEAVAVAGRMGLVKPHDHVVCVQRIHDDFCVKIVAVDEMGEGGCKKGEGVLGWGSIPQNQTLPSELFNSMCGNRHPQIRSLSLLGT